MDILKKIIVICFIFSSISTVSYASSTSFHEGDTGKQIAEIQVKLREQGYYKDKIDGKFTDKTTKAIKKFQQGKRLKADGIVDEKTYLLLIGKQIVGESQSPNNKITRITNTALSLVGVPYKWGGVTAKGFDCSGLVWYVFDKNTIHLPRTADIQYQAGKAVAKDSLQQGDLVFFTTYEPGASHSGIYLGQGKFVHASSSRGVMVSNLADHYWKTRYFGARRIV